ncbi:C40 family peptidase [Nocardia stercoris]|uniref:NlpC/P60 family protein n=1 Tax=Nocardia stercoris TaxID=2483361 RepID=A0A3M2KTW7_9NOCA|nr:C40 family peptidase [Nocardia stercoris]RMI29097.1 NlpC/P60 family protein [Nocardia stercoris]
MAIKRQVQGLHRNAHRAVAAGAVGAATFGALLVPAATASAAPVDIPGIGTVDVPDQIASVLPNSGSGGFTLPGVPGPEQTAGERAADAARSRVGDPYVYGATGPDAFDCSGLVQWSEGQAGKDVPRTSYEQLNSGAPVSVDELQPGDVVSYYGGGHSAIYVGDGTIVHASTPGSPVEYAPVDSMPIAGAVRF